jgi:hypothetical protein
MKFPFDSQLDCVPDEETYAMRVGREAYRRIAEAESRAKREAPVKSKSKA